MVTKNITSNIALSRIVALATLLSMLFASMLGVFYAE